jgi:hypothetical protein
VPAADDAPDLSSPCPEPAGGWPRPDPAKADEQAVERAAGLAEADPGYAALWLDQPPPTGTGTAGNDYRHLVLDVSTTGDVAAMERKLRTVWGGAVCVSKAPRTHAALARIQDALSGAPGMLGVSANGIRGRVELVDVVATTVQQRRLDATFGAGIVRLSGALQRAGLPRAVRVSGSGRARGRRGRAGTGRR